MTSADIPNEPPKEPPKSDDIPLEDIDALLAAEDPDFAKSLEEVRSVEIDASVEIQAAAIDETQAPDERQAEDQTLSKAQKIKNWLRIKQLEWRMKSKAWMRARWADTKVFLKTRPKQFAGFVAATAVIAGKRAMIPVQAFKEATRAQQITAASLILISVAIILVLIENTKGIWIPHLHEPLLTSFEHVADQVETFDEKDPGESFYSAFPQERHEFLFKKFKVNLKRTAANPDPMGAFEVIAELDSKDTAIEVRDRETEFHDLIQRVFEEETANDLATVTGKARVKSRLKRELNERLTQGWTRDITFKTFILKP